MFTRNREQGRGQKGGMRIAVGLLIMAASLGTAGMAGAASPGADPGLTAAQLSTPHRVTVGQSIPFQVVYKDKSGDIPTEGYVEQITPSGTKIQTKFQNDLSQVHAGSTLTAVYQPAESGVYKYRFFVRNANGPMTYPDGGDWLDYQVMPNWFPWAIIIGGFLVSFLIISTIIYQVMHRGMGVAQTPSARVAIMIGAICWMVAILFAEDWLTSILAWIAGGIIVLLIAVWALLSR